MHINYQIEADKFSSQVSERSQRILDAVDELSRQSPEWQQIVEPLEQLCEDFAEFTGLYGHVKSVVDSQELRSAYKQALPVISKYYTALEQHQGLYQALEQIARREANLTQGQQSALQHHLNAFKLSGVHLSSAKRQKFAELSARKSELTNSFAENVLDSTQEYERALSTSEVASVPASIQQMLANNAKSRKKSGHLATLDAPIVLALLRTSSDRNLRAELHRARSTRASELADSKLNNDANMLEIIRLRVQMAELVGFEALDRYLLFENILTEGEQVLDFIDKMFQGVSAQAQADYRQLNDYAHKHLGLGRLQSWDSLYAQEQMSQQLFSFDEEQLRPYFPVDHVITTMLRLQGELFDFEAIEVAAGDFDKWHDDVRLFKLQRGGQDFGYLYVDLYARQHKNGGAWMNEGRTRRRVDGKLQLPVAYLICNFRPPEPQTDALLSLDEFDTLLHESGHCLHHLLSEIDIASISGLRAVPMDGVEVPSQFMEYLLAHRSVFAQMSCHYHSGEALPETMVERIEAKRKFCKALFVNQQLQYALFDARLHSECQDIKTSADIHELWRQIRAQHSPFPPSSYDRFPNNFNHIFAGSYSLGYYSYLYSEVLSADAFAYIAGGDGQGAINCERARDFAEKVLARGGEQRFDTLYHNFRGQPASIDAYLRLNGLEAGS